MAPEAHGAQSRSVKQLSGWAVSRDLTKLMTLRPLLSSALSLLAEGFHEELLGAMASDGLSVKVTKVVVCVVYRFNSVLEKHQNRV